MFLLWRPGTFSMVTQRPGDLALTRKSQTVPSVNISIFYKSVWWLSSSSSCVGEKWCMFYNVKKAEKSHGRKLHSCREEETQSVPFIFINFFILNNLVLIVFKCTGTKIISLYLQYITRLVYTHQYIFIQYLYIQYTWRSWSCCTIVFLVQIIGWSGPGLDQTGRHLHSCLWSRGQHLWSWTWTGATWTDAVPRFMAVAGGPTSSFSTQPAEGCFCLLSKLYVIVQL